MISLLLLVLWSLFDHIDKLLIINMYSLDQGILNITPLKYHIHLHQFIDAWKVYNLLYLVKTLFLFSRIDIIFHLFI